MNQVQLVSKSNAFQTFMVLGAAQSWIEAAHERRVHALSARELPQVFSGPKADSCGKWPRSPLVAAKTKPMSGGTAQQNNSGSNHRGNNNRACIENVQFFPGGEQELVSHGCLRSG
jgi:hypothetical protein